MSVHDGRLVWIAVEMWEMLWLSVRACGAC